MAEPLKEYIVSTTEIPQLWTFLFAWSGNSPTCTVLGGLGSCIVSNSSVAIMVLIRFRLIFLSSSTSLIPSSLIPPILVFKKWHRILYRMLDPNEKHYCVVFCLQPQQVFCTYLRFPASWQEQENQDCYYVSSNTSHTKQDLHKAFGIWKVRCKKGKKKRVYLMA